MNLCNERNFKAEKMDSIRAEKRQLTAEC